LQPLEETVVDLRYSEQHQAFRAEVREFLAQHWLGPGAAVHSLPRDAQVVEFRRKGIQAGYLARGIPRKYGGSEQPPDVLKAAIIGEEFARANAPLDGAGFIVPTLLAHGSEWQKERFVAPTLVGEITWCQGYSEPGSGSDLASLKTRAELVGESWCINGQKIWTSGAQQADFMFMLARTEPEAPKHAGISYLLLEVKQPGITIQPLKQMTGASHFNQVFFENARTPADWIVGKRGQGWLVSRTTLLHERTTIGNPNRSLEQFARLVELARRSDKLADPGVRQRLATIEGAVRSHQYSSYYRLTRAARGQGAGVLDLMNKLVGTNISHDVARLALDLLGDGGLESSASARGNEAPDDVSSWVALYMGTLGTAIAGGTSNVQRNVIAERGLGLPRDGAANRHS
jgi:alkylation response protein AidB-like acyl-CoA dehydrogenase